ncbi:hypothetical protein [Salinibacter ruber]|uniref:hypothetical protein n=1 Tax=Salinibacter ruber TaxID=146919 RepID=UPI00216912BF|nr:hypothetical protein [Salinibacter ruber]MCS4221408.1 hypothetical protein [Salinibacter ruber]
MENPPTTFGAQTEVLEIVGGKEGVVTIRDACGEVLTAFSDAKALLEQLANSSTEDED